MTNDVSSCARLILMTSFYVGEKRLLSDMNSWLLCRTGNRPQEDCVQKSTLNEWLSDRLLDEQFEIFGPSRDSNMDLILLDTTHEKTYHLLSILRRVPQRLLYLFFGWKTTEKGSQAARRGLVHWFNENRERAREGLLHAAVLFRIIRDQTVTTYFDPLWLLIATLFMRAYVEVESNAPAQQQSARASLHEAEAPRTRQPTRIDYPLDESTRKLWAKSNLQPHVTGIGLLKGADSGPRVLKEAIRILSRRNGWNQLSHATARTLAQVLDNLTPTLKEATEGLSFGPC